MHICLVFFGGGYYLCTEKYTMNMKKFIFALMCAAMTLVCGCNKKGSGNGPVIDPLGKATWATLVEAYPFLDGFPVFDGEVENVQYRELGSDMKTVTFFDYECGESVATAYYAKFEPAGFTKSEGSHIYRKTTDAAEYIFTGSYSGGSFALSFNVSK